jgi:uncharacterized hydrophobic protein (TIGR00271 family)
MLHVRIVTPSGRAGAVLDLLERNASVCDVVHLPGAARSPAGDLVTADVPREDASVLLSDLRSLGLDEDGSITVTEIDAALSPHTRAVEDHGAPSDAVVWEEVQAHTQESTELSHSFLAFMVTACLIAAVGIYQDQPILIVGAMVVGPEFGPIAGFCVAAATRRKDVAWRSFRALAVGFPIGITAAWLATVVFRATGLIGHDFATGEHRLASLIASPDFFSFFVAVCAGVAGVLSLSTAKSSALIGVVISVTTIPAAANIGISFAYSNWHDWRGSMGQLAVNLTALLVAGSATLVAQRAVYVRRRRRHRELMSEDAPGGPAGGSVPLRRD